MMKSSLEDKMKTKICSRCKKEKSINDFYIRESNKRRAGCKKCKMKVAHKYKSEERGYLIDTYSAMSKPSMVNKRKIPCNITKQEFFEQWILHKERMGGIFCEYTGLPMTFNRGAKALGKNLICATNVSVDRLDNNKPYTVENIVFCRGDFNNRKNQVNLDDCVKIIELAKKRGMI